MKTIQELASEAQDLANGLTPAEEEVARVMTICNGCRYYEGFCAVFPAMTRRLVFAKADVNYLANLCHNCGACLHSCQYAPPHAFALSIPKAMAAVRGETYREYAWPTPLGKLYRRNGLTLSLSAFAALFFFLVLGITLGGHGWGALWGATDLAVISTIFFRIICWLAYLRRYFCLLFWRFSWVCANFGATSNRQPVR